MSTTQLSTIPSPPEGQDLATVPVKFEVTPIPVTDFDRAEGDVIDLTGHKEATTFAELLPLPLDPHPFP